MEINARTIAGAWPMVTAMVLTRGSPQKVIASGVERMTLEYPGVILTNIDMPYLDMIPKGSKFTEHALEGYAYQLITGENPGFDYTYGERLRKYGEDQIDQISLIVKHLKEDPTSRKEVAITWRPLTDALDGGNVPCMIVNDFKFRDGQLNLTVFFRSHDIYGAFPSNAYGLAKLLETVAKHVNAEVGRLSIISSGAHIYEYDLSSARMVTGCPA